MSLRYVPLSGDFSDSRGLERHEFGLTVDSAAVLVDSSTIEEDGVRAHLFPRCSRPHHGLRVPLGAKQTERVRNDQQRYAHVRTDGGPQ